jgi:nicotinate-nucleotide adenylyltransferase
MRVGVLGGSFNPPHVGHAMVAAWLRWVDLVDEVWLVPVGGHAFGKALPSLAQRVAWCEAMAADVGPWVRVSDIEGGLPVPSYTLHTLDALAARHPERAFRLVVGADVLAVTERWHRWDLISARYAPIVAGRAGCPPVDGCPDMPAVSSTEIRARLAAGQPVGHLLTASVRRLISAA